MAVEVLDRGAKANAPNSTDVGAVAAATDPPVAAAPEPSPTVDEEAAHDKRAAELAWWTLATSQCAVSESGLLAAASAINNGDVVSASSDLKDAAPYATNCANDADNEVPNGWADVSARLSDGASQLLVAINKWRDALDAQTPSAMSDARDDLASAQSVLDEATTAAQQQFKSEGGEGSNFKSPADTAAELLKVMSGAAGQ